MVADVALAEVAVVIEAKGNAVGGAVFEADADRAGGASGIAALGGSAEGKAI